jgi:hypothetical protein
MRLVSIARVSCLLAAAAGVVCTIVACQLALPMDGYEGTNAEAGIADANIADGKEAGAADGSKSDASIFCKVESCDIATSFCCFDQCAGTQNACQPLGEIAACKDCGVPLLCDGLADCADRGADAVCCGVLIDSKRASRVSCLSLFDCQRSQHIVLCDPRDTPPCPNGAACNAVTAGLGTTGFACEGL